MTKGPEKEFVWCVVERTEADNVFAEMARAGRITEPGRGVMYSIPVDSGIVHVSSVVWLCIYQNILWLFMYHYFVAI